MKKISTLIFHNLKKEKGQYFSFGIIILLTAFILNLALVLAFQVDKAYDRKFEALNTADINFCIPQVQNTVDLEEGVRSIKGVKRLDCREGIFTTAVVKDFRKTDFSMNTVFYNMDAARKLNEFVITEQSSKGYGAPIYIPVYVAQFGQFRVGDEITYQIDSKEYTFQIAGIVEEMQYGNYGTGLMGAYMPEETYSDFAEENKKNQIAEYSLITDESTDAAEVTRKVSDYLDGKGLNLVSISNSDTSRQTRTMVCNLLILILIAFACVILLVSMLLCKFRIQNTIEEDMANMGVLKAIGYTSQMIICTTILPYVIVGILTALAGILCSYALLPVLSSLLAIQSGFIFTLHFDFAALGSVLVILAGIILLFTYLAAGRIRRLEPINAIRGNCKGRHGKRNYFPLDETAGSLKVNLILKQITASAKQNVLLFLVSFFIMILVAFAGTLFYNVIIEPDNFMSTLSEESPDIIFQAAQENGETLKYALKEDSRVNKALTYSTETVEYEDGSITAFICEDFAMVSNDLCYEGRNPRKENEIAIGNALAGRYTIGDSIEIKNDEATCTYEIVGFIQSVNYQGNVCELTQEGYLKLNHKYDFQSLYVYLQDDVDVETYLTEFEKENAAIIAKSINSAKMAQTSKEMFAGLVSIIIMGIFILTVLIVLLILYIVIKSLIVQRKQEFGIYKAMGYSNLQLIMQVAGSFLPVSFAAVFSSALLGMIYMPVIDQVIFQMIGAMKNNFHVSLAFLLIFAVLQIFIHFVISIWLSLPIKKISAYSLIKE